MPARIIYKTGDKLHPESRLTYIEDVEKTNSKRMALFQCACGGVTKTYIFDVKNGTTKSCGCYRSEASKFRCTTHGLSKSKIYAVWHAMTRRCTDPRIANYYNYGGRGITICDEWLKFENFYADMGDRPSDKHSIDRIDNNGNYEPDNCRWATRTEQNRNSRSNVNLTFKGRTQCLAAWSDELRINYGTLSTRINRRGLSAEKALTTRVQS